MKTKQIKNQKRKNDGENKASKQATLIYGVHAVTQILEQQPERVLHLYVAKERHDNKIAALLQFAAQQRLSVSMVARTTLDTMTHDANHQGVIAQCKPTKTYGEADLVSFIEQAQHDALFLLLDGVQDPHNLGACFRSADAFGATAVIAPKDKSVGLTQTVSKVASGAAETVPFIQVINLVRTMELLKSHGVWIYGAIGEVEKSIYQIDFTVPVAIVLGAEGTGLRRLTREHCDDLAKIPMLGTVASLNVSVATGILLAEVRRQRSR